MPRIISSHQAIEEGFEEDEEDVDAENDILEFDEEIRIWTLPPEPRRPRVFWDAPYDACDAAHDEE